MVAPDEYFAQTARDSHPTEWYEQRVGLVTSSVAPAIFGLCRFTSPYQAKMIIRGEYRRPAIAAMYRGKKLERPTLEVGAEWACALTERQLQLDSTEFKRHPNGWMGDSADALLFDEVTGELLFVVEAKTVAGDAAYDWGKPGSDQVPDYVLVQCYWHLEHYPTTLACIVPVLLATPHGSLEFQVYLVPRNDGLAARLIREAHAWHREHIILDKPLQPDHRDSDAVARRWPRHEIDRIEMTDALLDLARTKLRWRDARREAERAEAAAENRIRELMGAGGAARGQGISITNRNIRDEHRVRWEQLARHLGASDEMIQQFTDIIPGGRRLRVTPLKGK